MALNNDPIYTRVADIQSTGAAGGAGVVGPTANTSQLGTGTNIYPVFIADATNGGFLSKLMMTAVGTVTATVCRVFISDATATVTSGALSGNTVSNTFLLHEVTLPAVTLSQTALGYRTEVPLNMAIPPNYRVSVAFGTSTGAANNGWSIVSIGGKY